MKFLFVSSVVNEPAGIDLIRTITVGLERACDGGSCGGNNLHLKLFPRISLSFMLVSSTTVRIRIWPFVTDDKLRLFESNSYIFMPVRRFSSFLFL